MTVSELIGRLKAFPDDTIVCFEDLEYGNYLTPCQIAFVEMGEKDYIDMEGREEHGNIVFLSTV